MLFLFLLMKNEMKFCRSLRRFFRLIYFGTNLFDTERIRLPFPPCRIRRFVKDDLDECGAIFERNQAGIFPPNTKSLLQENLLDPGNLSLVLESNNQIVGTGSIGIYEYTDEITLATISGGMIHPDFHGRGFGTLSLIARLSLLHLAKCEWLVSMSSVGGGTEKFFLNSGFKSLGKMPGENVDEVEILRLRVLSRDIRHFRSKLREDEVDFPGYGHFEIPRVDMREDYEALLSAEES